MDRITSSPPFLEAIESLKALKQSSWASTSVPESDSLSEHIHQMALVCLAHPDLTGEDEMKAIAMCLTHDVGNIASGEVTLVLEHHQRGEVEEQLGLNYLTSILRAKSPALAERLPEARRDYMARETRVAQLVHQVHTFQSLHHAAVRRKKGRQTMGDDEFERRKGTITDAWLARETEQILSDEWDPLEEMADPRAPIIFAIGGPGTDRRRHCARLAGECGLEMVSADRLLREEQNRPGSIFGDFIKESLEKSVLAPTSLTTMLLKSKIKEIQSRGRGVLIEGFPQSVSQAVAFDREVSHVYWTIYFEEPVDQTMKRTSIAAVPLGESLGAAEMRKSVMEYMSKNFFRTVQMTESGEGVNSVLRDVVKEIKQQGKQRRGMT